MPDPTEEARRLTAAGTEWIVPAAVVVGCGRDGDTAGPRR